MNQAISETRPLIEGIQSIVGADFCLTDERDRDFYSTDLSFREREIAEAVVQPQSTDELSSVVSLHIRPGLTWFREAAACPTRAVTRRPRKEPFLLICGV